MTVLLEDGKLRLSGYVGDYYFEDGFTSSDVVIALAQIDDSDPLTVHVNSGGGIASEGAAIHALLSARAGRTDVVVEGVAASAASLIAMAGETVTMAAGSVMMIHDPSGFTFGTSKDHSKTIEGLEALATAYSRVYAQKSGKSPADCRAIMTEERWFSPQQAVDEGFADATTEDLAPQPVAAFDYRIYAHAPRALRATAKRENWQLTAADDRAASPGKPTRQQKEPSMTDTTTADAKAAELTAAGKAAVASYQTRRKAVMSLPEAKGREALAERLIDTDLSEETIKETLAVAPAAAEPAPQASTAPAPEAYADERARAAAGLAAPAAAGDRKDDVTSRILANYRTVTGAPAKKA